MKRTKREIALIAKGLAEKYPGVPIFAQTGGDAYFSALTEKSWLEQNKIPTYFHPANFAEIAQKIVSLRKQVITLSPM